MKKLLISFILLFTLVLAGCSGTEIDKDKYPNGGIVVFVGYDKSLYFLIDSSNDIALDSSYGTYTISYGDDESFTSTDVRYEYSYKNKEDLNQKLKQFGHKELK